MKKLTFLLTIGVTIGLFTLSSSSTAVNPVFSQTGDCDQIDCPDGSYRAPLPGSPGRCECVPDVGGSDETLGGGSSGFGCSLDADLSVTDPVLDFFYSLKISNSELEEELSTPPGVISRVLSFAFPLAGIILFLMLVVSRFQILMAAGNDKKMQAGMQRATYAVIGFMLLFASYWIAVLLGQILNVKLV